MHASKAYNIIKAARAFVVQQSNLLYFVLRNGLFSLAITIGSMTAVQAFLIEHGVNNAQLGVLTALVSITLIVSMLLTIKRVDTCRDPIKTISLTTIAQVILPVIVMSLCLIRVTDSVVFWLVAAAVVIQNLNAGYRNTLDAKLYLYLDMKPIGRFIGIIGMVNGLSGIGAIVLMAVLLRAVAFPLNIFLIFLLSMVFILLTGFFNAKIKLVGYSPSSRSNGKSVFGFLKLRVFYLLLLPNVLRGIGIAAGSFLYSIGVYRLHIGTDYLAAITAATVFAGITGSLLFTLLINRLEASRLILIGGLMWGVGFLLILFMQSTTVYIAICFLIMLGQTLVDLAVPTGIYEFVDREIIGEFTTARLSITMGVSAVAAVVIGKSLDSSGLTLIAILICACILVCGISFMLVFKRYHPKPPHKQTALGTSV